MPLRCHWPLATSHYVMNLPFELHVALRYLLARRKQAFISVISAASRRSA